MLFDIHSHILPAVDDGASDLQESLSLLELMKNQGITHVIATPHFYPQEDNLENFLAKTQNAARELEKEIADSSAPKIFLGAEMLYFKGIGNSYSLNEFCINGSDYLLLELLDEAIGDYLFEDLENMINNLKITPIIAHIERYSKSRNYRKLLKFVKENHILTQVNASAFFIPYYKRTIKKLFKLGIVSFIASDSHSSKYRPPMLKEAYEYIEEHFGENVKQQLIDNSNTLLGNITSSGDIDA